MNRTRLTIASGWLLPQAASIAADLLRDGKRSAPSKMPHTPCAQGSV